MKIENVAVEQINSKDQNTRFGMKKVFSFKADGNWYKTNFKDHNVKVGDVITFDSVPSTYGNEVDPATIVTGWAGATPAPAPAAPVTLRPSHSATSNKGSFPIPLLDGQRAIVRQNALTQAREMWVASHGGKVFEIHQNDLEDIVQAARFFESYACGDLDMAAAQAEIDKAA